MRCTVNLFWDDEAMVWVAISDDIPGLALGSGSVDALIERVKYAAAELIELNGLNNDKKMSPFTFFPCIYSEKVLTNN